jgi:hypothetical protein
MTTAVCLPDPSKKSAAMVYVSHGKMQQLAIWIVVRITMRAAISLVMSIVEKPV